MQPSPCAETTRSPSLREGMFVVVMLPLPPGPGLSRYPVLDGMSWSALQVNPPPASVGCAWRAPSACVARYGPQSLAVGGEGGSAIGRQGQPGTRALADV